MECAGLRRIENGMPITRRNFFRLSSATLLSAALAAPQFDSLTSLVVANPKLGTIFGRVTRSSIFVYQKPDMDSRKVTRYRKDKIITLEEELHSPAGPNTNPRWYKVESGYVHSAYIQRIENIIINESIPEITGPGFLGKITVPFTQTWIINKYGHWKKLYRLYYDSLHWITGMNEHPEGEPMAQITDEWLKVRYFAPLKHIQPLDHSVYEPLSPDVPEADKRIIVSIESQVLSAFEAEKIVYRCKISSGLRYMETPTGSFYINRKYPSRHMGNGGLTSDILAYELPGVPWVSFFTDTGIAFHGTYWHDNFGNPMSRGCVNLSYEDARWIFRWTTPSYTEMEGDKPAWKIESRTGVKVEVY
jgi:hypothetical protein